VHNTEWRSLEAIDTLPALGPTDNDTCVQEHLEMLGDKRIGEPGRLDERANGSVFVTQDVQQFAPIAVRDRVKRV